MGNVQTSSDFVGQPLLFQGGETYTFTANPIPGPGDGVLFGSWTINDAPISQSVPEPSSILGLLSLGGLAIKKVSKNSKKK
ncbi:MAG: PEP-CTERM sorting domain-containing protein [Crocosphaera sp.]